jgi:hypothetical protein
MTKLINKTVLEMKLIDKGGIWKEILRDQNVLVRSPLE